MMKGKAVAASVVLLLLTFAVFFPVLSHDFTNIDDNLYVTQNPVVSRGLTLEGLAWAFTSVGHIQNWHPLTWLSHMLDVELFGMDPGRHHLVSLLIHACNAVLLFLVLRGMTGTFWRSAFVAALFAVHPLHVESVAWIAERKDVLSTFCMFLSLGAYARYSRKGGMPPYLASLLAFALGLLAKPMVVTLPFVLLLLDFWPLERRRLPLLVAEKVPFLLLSAASAAVTLLAQSRGGAVSSFDVLPLSSRVSNALVAYAKYALKTVAPVRLSFFYPHPEGGIPFWQLAAAAAGILAVTLLAAARRRRLPWLPVGWLWFLGTLVPVIGLVQVGGQAMADRYTYVPLVGLFIVLSWGGVRLAGGRRRAAEVLAAAGAAILLVAAVAAHRQVRVWRNSSSLLSHALELDKGNWMAHNKLGELYDAQGRRGEAIRHFNEVLRIKPFFFQANNNLGILYAELGMTSKAVEHLLVAARVAPREERIHFNLGNLYYRTGDYRRAAASFREALRLDPALPEAHLGAGDAEAKLGRVSEAIAFYRSALRLRPGWPDALAGLGMQLYARGDFEGAVAALSEAVRAAPSHGAARLYLERAREELRRRR